MTFVIIHHLAKPSGKSLQMIVVHDSQTLTKFEGLTGTMSPSPTKKLQGSLRTSQLLEYIQVLVVIRFRPR